ncbi:MAG: lamin tail domain-containing protein [Hyphomicrobiales bacterium]
MQNFTIKSLITLAILLAFGTAGMSQVIPTGWEIKSGIETFKSKDKKIEGNTALRVKINTGDQSICELTSTVPFDVTAGQKIKISFQYITGAATQFKGAIIWDDGEKEWFKNYSLSKDDNTWKTDSYTVDVPTGKTTAKVYFRFYDIPNSGFISGVSCYLDDIKVEHPIGTPFEISNGNFEEWPALKDAPSSYPTTLAATIVNGALSVNWIDAIGDILPDRYQVIVSEEEITSIPQDGTQATNDNDLSDGSAVLNVLYGTQTCSFDNADASKVYHVTIFPFNNTGEDTKYKNDETAPTAANTVLYEIAAFDFTGGFQGWTPVSVIGDEKEWEVKKKSGNDYLHMSGYTGKATDQEDWIISPKIGMKDYSDRSLSFDNSLGFPGIMPELKYSIDYDGTNFETATWNELSGIAWYDKKDFDTFKNSGLIDLSAIAGDNAYFAFVYKSNPTDKTKTVQIDNVIFSGVPTGPMLNITSNIGGGLFEQGKAVEINWNVLNYTDNVKIELLKGDAVNTVLVETTPATEKAYTWNIPVDFAVGNDYKIKISGIENTELVSETKAFEIEVPYVIPTLIISEIMYNSPIKGEDKLEFIEIYNAGDEDVNLDGFYLYNAATHIFGDVTIKAKGFVVVCKNKTTFDSFFGTTETPTTDAIEWAGGSLSNNGKEIILKDARNNIINSVSYKPNNGWDPLADGKGHSLVMCDIVKENNDPSVWHACPVFAKEYISTDYEGNEVKQRVYATPFNNELGTLKANFYTGTQKVDLNTTVTFTNESTGFYTAFEWKFTSNEEDVNTTDRESVTFTYETEGDYDVALTVSNGCVTNTETKEGYINVSDLPSVNFSATETEITTGDTTYFVCPDMDDNAIYTYDFEDGDGIIIDEEDYKNVSVKYTSVGTFNVSLTANYGDDYSLEIIEEKEDYITVTNGVPGVHFEASKTNLKVGETTIFTSSNMVDYATYKYNVSDGNGVIVNDDDMSNVEVRYNTAGDFDVELNTTYTVNGESVTAIELKEDYIHVATGLNESDSKNISIHPQPANTYLTINYKKEGNYEIRMLNLQGQMVKKFDKSNFGQKVNVSDLEKGTYLIQIVDTDNNSVVTKKFLLQ